VIDTIFVCYLFKINKGSEWLLGENTFWGLEKDSYIVTARHQLEGDVADGAIGSFKYKRKDGRIAVVGMFGAGAEPKTPMGFRVDYLFWSLRVYALLKKRALRRNIRHINFAQVLTPIPKNLCASKNFMFGPVGGQGPWYKVSFLPFKNRVINFLIFKCIYGAIANRISKMNVTFVHPILAQRFKSELVQPAIQLKREEFIESKKKPQVIHVSRRVYFKLPDLHRIIFENLAAMHPEYDFIIVGAGWGALPSYRNLCFLDSLPRNEIMALFAESSFHINLSLELAGIVNLEAAVNKCITIGSKMSGAEYLLGLSGDYVIDIYNPRISVNTIVEQLSKTIQVYDNVEADRQYKNAQQHTFNVANNINASQVTSQI